MGWDSMVMSVGLGYTAMCALVYFSSGILKTCANHCNVNFTSKEKATTV